MLKIGDFSKLSRVSVKTLRYYDEVGLLNSSQVDRFTGYRYYSIEQIPRLNRILAFKDLGFSLEQIARLLDENLPPAQIRGMLRMKQAEIQDQLEEEQARLRRIEARLRQIEQEDSMPTYDIVLKKVDPQRVISVRDTLPTFGDQVSLWIELANYLISRKTKAAGPSITIYHDPEYCERDVDLETATPVSVSLPESQRVKVRELPGIDVVATLIHKGRYENFGQTYSALVSWIEANGYRITGPNREVYLLCAANVYDDPTVFGEYLTEDPDEFLTEIQFPVDKV